MQAEIAKPWLAFYKELDIETPDFEDLPVGSYVQNHARVRPNAPALAYFDKVISYSELNTAANQLANALTALGIKRGDVIGLHMPNIPQYAIAIIAISKMGAIGTGLSASPEQASEVISLIHEIVKEISGGIDIPILYGGSVNEENHLDFQKEETINGLLIGSACLDPITFSKIINNS